MACPSVAVASCCLLVLVALIGPEAEAIPTSVLANSMALNANGRNGTYLRTVGFNNNKKRYHMLVPLLLADKFYAAPNEADANAAPSAPVDGGLAPPNGAVAPEAAATNHVDGGTQSQPRAADVTHANAAAAAPVIDDVLVRPAPHKRGDYSDQTIYAI